MYSVEQHFRDLNSGSNPDNNPGNGNNTNSDNSNPANVSNANNGSSTNSSPNILHEGRIALQDDAAFHLGDEGLFDLPVLPDRHIITIQPGPQGERAPMPVSSEGWRTTSTNHFVPLSGLDFLGGAESVIIQQTVELTDLLATIESENRYLVKVPRGEALYLAYETSSNCQRACCGSSRGFEIKLLDHTRQLGMVFRRDLACNVCWFGCCLQEVKVYAAQGQLIGRILQQWTFLIPSFFVIDGSGHLKFRIEGPPYLFCHMKKGSEFKILSRDGAIQHGSIVHTWDRDLCNYNVTIEFPTSQIDTETKALILGAGFLLEYMFFETSKRASCKCCC